MGSRVVLTTGANSGIGLATALEVARRGFVSVGSVRSAAKAATVQEAAAAAGVEVHTVLLDVTDAERCAAAVSEVAGRHGGLYGLVNNAGYGTDLAVEDIGDEEARAMLETMVIAPTRLARLALPLMRDGGGGRIVNISSIYGRTTTPLTGWYQAAKHALEGVSDALRMEVARDGIAVILVQPGAFKTGIWEGMDTPDPAGTRYGAAYQRARQNRRLIEPLMGNPDQCAKIIAGALTTRLPRARYLVGVDAVMLAAAQGVTPTAVKDRLTRLAMGL
jgi:NAD(P)-dependent dehydrogenase (short-subunit alcohol dehydrogenase family)